MLICYRLLVNHYDIVFSGIMTDLNNKADQNLEKINNVQTVSPLKLV